MVFKRITILSCIIIYSVSVYAQFNNYDNNSVKELDHDVFIASKICANTSNASKEIIIRNCEHAIVLSKRNEMDSLTIINLSNISEKLYAIDGFEATYKYLNEAKQIAEQSENMALKMPAYYSYGLMWERHIDIESALDYFIKASEIAINLDNIYYRSKIISVIGYMLVEEGLHEKAKEYYKKGLIIAKEKKDAGAIAMIESSLAIPYRELGEYDESGRLFRKAYKYFASVPDTAKMKIILFGLGKLESKKGNHKLSNEIFYGKLDSLGWKHSSSKFIKEVLAYNYYHLQKYKKAIKLYKEIENDGIQLSDFNVDKKILKGMADCYSSLGEHEMASNYYLKYADNISFNNKEKVKKSTTTANLKYNLQSKESENKYLLTERENIVLQNKTKTYKYFIFIILLGLFSLMLIYSYGKQKRRNKFLEAVGLEHEKINQNLLSYSQKKDMLNQELVTKNEELSSFAGVVAHDIKAPIRTIGSFIQLLRKHILQDGDVKQYLNFIEKSNQQLNTLIDDLLAHARTGKYFKEIELVDLNQIIHFVRNNLTHIINKKSAIIKAEQLPKILANTTAIIQLFQNLIANSIKFSKDAQAPIIEITSQIGIDFRTIIISDNGIGIEQKYLNKIFDPLTKLHSKDKYEGSGLGLATCKKIIERLGGTIEVESTLNEGSIFKIHFPNKFIESHQEQKFKLN